MYHFFSIFHRLLRIDLDIGEPEKDINIWQSLREFLRLFLYSMSVFKILLLQICINQINENLEISKPPLVHLSGIFQGLHFGKPFLAVLNDLIPIGIYSVSLANMG